jgi:hypothetical protein
MAIVLRANQGGRMPAYLTGYGDTKLEAARSARARFKRRTL